MNLKDVLRKGDPAAGDRGLSQEEVQAMRRTVLSAVPEPRRRGWLIPVIAATAAAVLVLAAVLALSLWRMAPVEPVHIEAVRRPVPSPPWPPSPPSLGERGTEKPPPSMGAGRRRPLHRNGGEGRGEGGRDQTIAQLEPPHQIQFSTPGGTRVIWLLHPAGE